MVHRPQDLDTASSLALLQEEAMQDQVTKRIELGSYSKKTSSEAGKSSVSSITNPTRVTEDKKGTEPARSKTSDEKLSSLKQYRRAKGLCFKCGEKWSPQHKCPTAISLHAMEELWNCFSDGNESESQLHHQEDSDSGEDLMAISVQAIHGIEGSKTIRLKGHLSGKDVFMLIDLGSSHGFINEETAKCISGWQALSTPAQVQVANGEVLHCTHQQLWGIQGHSFSTTSKILPLQGHYIILGIDWLGSHSPMEIHWVDRWVKFTQGSH
jgi:hypothetical protein